MARSLLPTMDSLTQSFSITYSLRISSSPHTLSRQLRQKEMVWTSGALTPMFVTHPPPKVIGTQFSWRMFTHQ